MNNIIIEKTYSVEILVKAASTANQIFFPIIQVLDTKLTQGVETYDVATIPKAPSNTALVNSNLLNSSFLNLVVGDTQQIWNLPLRDLVTVNNALGSIIANPFAIEFDNLKIVWAKSYIYIADVTTISAVANQVYFFNIKYADPK